MKFQTLSIIVLLAASTAAFAAGTERRAHSPNSEQNEKLSQPAALARTPTVAATVSYSGSIAATPIYNRPVSCATLSTAGNANGYHVQQFSVDTAGSYSVEVLSTTMPEADSFLTLYLGAFDPASPLSNCIALNDDIGGGNLLSRVTTNLNAAVVYIAVTSSFSPGQVGNISNRIDGPGNITLGGSTGPTANLGITKSAPDGIVNGSSYRYRLAASNAGPDGGTGVVVTDILPAAISFVSSTCGATASGQTVTWTIGALANGGSASCDLTVNRAAMMCSTVANTATIAGTLPDANTANNSATHTNGVELVTDGSFEAVNAVAWAQTSTNFGSPLCDVAGCGNGAGTAGPRTGTQWIWFGGADTLAETASVEQAVTLPAGANSLTFGYWLGVCGTGGAADFIRLTVGGTELWRRNASSTECGAAGYSVATVDISALAAGVSRNIRFEATTGTAGNNSNFHIDDVSIAGLATCVVPTFTVGGNLTGLAGTGLVLRNNAGDNLPVAANGAFTFTTPVASGGAYAVTVFAQPGTPSQVCAVSNGSGTIAGANISNVTVICTTSGGDPTITPVATSRAQGSPMYRSVIANVSDAAGVGSVLVTVNGGASATVNGVLLQAIQNNNGVISAAIRGGCFSPISPPVISFTLTASSSSGSNTANLPITITAGSNPTWCQWWPR